MTFVNSKLTEITTNVYFIVSEDIQKEFRICLGLNYLRDNSVGAVISVIHASETARVRGGPLTCR